MPKKSKFRKATDVRAQKPWLKKSKLSKYPIKTIEKRKTFLIVCEGQTEEMYFKSFPVATATIRAVPTGCSKSKLVEQAKNIALSGRYDFVWCVFDLDRDLSIENQFQDFNSSIMQAEAAGFKCAYSIDAFELWFILHYEFIDQEQLRTFFYQKLSKYWDINYEKVAKRKQYASTIYQKLEMDPRANQVSAITNAERLFEIHKGKQFHNQNPVTKIYELVKELNNHLRK